MKTSSKILLTAFMTIIVVSIISIVVFKSGIEKYVIKEHGPKYTKETTLEYFNKIEVSGGFEIEYIPSPDSKILIEADSGIHKYIVINVEDSVLGISSNISIRNRVKCKLYSASFNSLKAASGSVFYANDSLSYNTIVLKASSGSKILLKGFYGESDITASSGSSIKIVGTGNTSVISASSGSKINVEEFETINALVKASSGADICVDSKNINAESSSGAKVVYNKGAVLTNISISSGGSINPKN